MTDLTHADELRAAAKQMRRLADHVPPPPWDASLRDVATPDGGDSIARCPTTVRAHYIASMHPGVTLAVAEWLECEAVMVDQRGISNEGQTFHALKLARAYLRTEDDGEVPF